MFINVNLLCTRSGKAFIPLPLLPVINFFFLESIVWAKKYT